MPKSMTGYGRGEYICHARRFTVEIKSVNHRYNDISVRLPKALASFEDIVRKLVATVISRGKTDVFVSFESFSETDVSITLNEPLLRSYYTACQKAAEILEIHNDINMNTLVRLHDVFKLDKEFVPCENEISEGLQAALSAALSMINEMKKTEGNALAKDIEHKLTLIEQDAAIIAEYAPGVALDYEKRLKDKLLNTLAGVSYDESRLIQEITMFADKSCIDEELTRLRSHISQMREILMESVSIGRKLDFLTQELNREINTIASKSNNLDITKLTVNMKSELEKIREQIQNIE